MALSAFYLTLLAGTMFQYLKLRTRFDWAQALRGSFALGMRGDDYGVFSQARTLHVAALHACSRVPIYCRAVMGVKLRARNRCRFVHGGQPFRGCKIGACSGNRPVRGCVTPSCLFALELWPSAPSRRSLSHSTYSIPFPQRLAGRTCNPRCNCEPLDFAHLPNVVSEFHSKAVFAWFWTVPGCDIWMRRALAARTLAHRSRSCFTLNILGAPRLFYLL